MKREQAKMKGNMDDQSEINKNRMFNIEEKIQKVNNSIEEMRI